MNTDVKYLSVSALNKYLYYKFDNDLNLRSVYLKAEISNIRLSKGIYYFVLKDSESEISALMYESYASKLAFKLEDGMTVLVNGRVALYHKRGTYAITVAKMDAIGLGEAYLNFLKLKEKLMNEGLFNEEYKKQIKVFNHKIALITSKTGDAMHDVISTINKRYPLAEVVLYPAIVQGADAPASLIKAIMLANIDATCDCIIIARGGGSIEDLSCFNDEGLARAIFDSNIPVISGVGHEADFTICDFVADRRAPTPTGAAVIASPDSEMLINDINSYEVKIKKCIKDKMIDLINQYKNLSSSYVLRNFGEYLNKFDIKLENYQKRLNLLSPLSKIDASIKELKLIDDKIISAYNLCLSTNEAILDNNINKLILLNPLNIMSKGYSVTMQNNKVIAKIEDVDKDLPLYTKVYGGEIESVIKDVRKDNSNE